MDGPRAPFENELPGIVQFLDSHLRPKEDWSISSEYPIAFSSGNLGNIRIIRDDEKILSHALMRPLIIKSPVGLFKVAGIGSVVMQLGLVLGPEPLKGAYSYGQAWQRAAISRSQVILSEAMAIVDLGVQWRWRRLYVAAVLGAGIGICVGCARGPEANAQEIVLTGAFGAAGNTRFVWAVDLDFLRLGIAL